MSAVNPLPPSDVSSDKRPYEPSMEEILASIRRIIADDQSLPGRPVVREAEQGPFAPILKEPQRSSLANDRPAPADVAAPAPDMRPEHPPTDRAAAGAPVQAEERLPLTPEPLLDSGMAHGSIAAPQFAMPDRPAGVDHRPTPAPVLIPQVTSAVLPQSVVRPSESAAPAPPPEDPVEDELLYDTPVGPVPRGETPTERPQLFSAATDSAVSAAFNMLAASRLADNSDELMTLAREMIRPLLRTWIDDNLPSMVERMVRSEIERVARGGR